jgi:hypothetical protein
MKKIFRFFSLLIGKLTLDNLSSLATETVEAARGAVNLMTASLPKLRFAALDASATTLRTLLDHARANPLTAELVALDGLMKEKYDYLKRTITYFASPPDSAKTTAAKRLLGVFKPYWDVMSKSLLTQSTKLKELRQRIASMGDNLEALTTLELMPTWLAFTALDDQFNALYDQRLETNALSTPAAYTIRDAVVTDYEAFCSVLELIIATEPTEQLEILCKKMNEIRTKFAPHHRIELTGANTSIAKIADQTYFGGKALTPIGRTFYQTGTETVELEFPKDFEVSYENNKNVGQATLIIHGKGKYTGQVATTFYIVRTN